MKKKLLLGTASVATVVAPIAAVISCSVNDYGKGFEYYGSIQVITDAGSVADKSFNESAFWAAKDFVQDTTLGGNQTFGYSQPKSSTKVLMQKAYLSAIKKGAKTLVLPGFTHSDESGGDAVHFAFDNNKKYPDVKYISPDGGYFGPGGDASAVKDGNFYNLGYASQESGFLTAIYSGIFMNEKKKVEGDTLKVATFGGIPIAYGVTSYMDGFLQGAQWFNDYIDDSKITKDSANNNVAAKHADVLAANFKKEELVFLGGNKASGSDFTGSFDAGVATSKVTTLIQDKGAQIILPVAGPQTGDVTGVISQLNKKGKVYAIGVDVDQAPIYGNDLILGSAIKGIYASVMIAQKEMLQSSGTIGTIDSPLDDHGVFKQFNKSAESSKYASEIFDELRTKNAITKKYSDSQMAALTQFTGFVPSDADFFKSDIEITNIYKGALDFLINPIDKDHTLMAGLEDDSKWEDPFNGTSDAQTVPVAGTNADKAFKNFGGFMQIAHGKENK